MRRNFIAKCYCFLLRNFIAFLLQHPLMLLQNVASIIKRGITTLQSISIQMKWHWSFSLGLN